MTGDPGTRGPGTRGPEDPRTRDPTSLVSRPHFSRPVKSSLGTRLGPNDLALLHLTFMTEMQLVPMF